jgi:hypothetical protein
MTSRVPPDLAGRNVSVQFADLDLNAAVRKIFEGQMLDFVYVNGQGVIVTAAAQPVSRTAGAAPTPFPRDPSPFESAPAFPQEQPPFVQDPLNPPNAGVLNGVPAATGVQGANPFGNQPQPAVIQTPFGPIPNPRLNQNGNVQPQQNAPLAGPGATPFGNPFGGAAPFGQPQTLGSPFGQAGLPADPFANPTTSTPGASPVAPITTQPLAPAQQQAPR